jgi:hypothetical protein
MFGTCTRTNFGLTPSLTGEEQKRKGVRDAVLEVTGRIKK